MTAAFVTVEEVKVFLPIRSGNYEFDNRLNDFILTASQQIETATNRRFSAQEHVETFSTQNTARQVYDFGGTSNEYGTIVTGRSQMFTLRGFPVASDPAPVVKYDPSRAFEEDAVVSPQDYVLNTSHGSLILTIPTVACPSALQVTYTSGYEIGEDGTLSAALPSDLKLACTVQAINLFNRTQPDAIGVDTSRGEGGSKSAKWSSTLGLTPEVIGMIRHYKALAVGRG